MERSGMRWTEAMAEAIVKLRAIYLSGDFDQYCPFHIHKDQERQHPASRWTVVEKKSHPNDLAKRFPEDTDVQFNYLPTLRAKIALLHSNPQQAIDMVAVAAPYELGLPAYGFYNWPNLYPVYVRGEAYLAAHQGREAAAEFQKILDHRGIVLNEPIGALAHLQLGRAYAMQRDTTKARAAYQDFLTLWKDADPDIPILKQAKAECAKLQ